MSLSAKNTLADSFDETEYLSSSEKMTDIILQGMDDSQSGNYQIVNVDEL